MIKIFKQFKNNIPHILFYGDTETCDILNTIKSYYPENCKDKYIIKLECATSKGIKNIRDDIKLFAKQQLLPNIPFKSVILYDAEYLTIDAQYSLRRSIEIYSHSTRFFIITKNKDKLLQPIRSRFIQIYIPHRIQNIKKYIPYTNIKNIMNIETSPSGIVDELYSKGIYADQLLIWLKNKVSNYVELKFRFREISREFKDERLILFYLVCFFRNNKEL